MNYLRSKLFLLVIFFSFSMAGCVGVVKIPTNPLYSSFEDEAGGKIKSLTSKYNQINFDEDLRKCTTLECSLKERNIILNELIFLIDFYYHQYEGSFIAGNAKSSFGFGVATTALSLASAVSTVESVKTAVSSVASLTSSTRTEIDKNFYYDQTAQALIVKMRSLRTVSRLDLLNGTILPYENYTIEQGLGDILKYYRAGTMANAVQAIYEDAAKQSVSAQAEIEQKTREMVEIEIEKMRRQN